MLVSPPPLTFPPSLDPIAYIIGLRQSMMLARAAQGAPIWIPHPRWLDHEQLVVKVLGMDIARELCEEMGGAYWEPPSTEEVVRPVMARMVLAWSQLQVPLPEIASRVGMSESRVHQLLTAVAMWYQTGDLTAAAEHAGESPAFLSLMLNQSC